MKIEDVETIKCHNWLLVRVHTDTGIAGVGQTAYWGYQSACEEIVRDLATILRGEDPLRIEHHWHRMVEWKPFRDSALMGAISAIDIALWDIAGKHLEVPIHQLMGGRRRDRARLHTLVEGDTPEALAASAAAAVSDGFTAVKIDGLPDGVVEAAPSVASTVAGMAARAAAVREEVGWDVDVILEIHKDLAPGEAISLIEEIRPLRLLFCEDPIVPYSVDSLGDVVRATRGAVGTGERNINAFEFRELLVRGVRYLRPDIGLAGGLTQLKQIAVLAEAFHAEISAHNFFSPLLTAATAQLYAAITNASTLEYFDWEEEPPRSEMLRVPLRREGGYLVIPDGPGLGVEFDESLVDRYPYTPWAYPGRVRTRPDGSVFVK